MAFFPLPLSAVESPSAKAAATAVCTDADVIAVVAFAAVAADAAWVDDDDDFIWPDVPTPLIASLVGEGGKNGSTVV